ADWLQGPFVYALYRSYGYSIEDIGSLFIVGFLTSGVFGMFVGGLADSFGRKKACLMYCILYALACVLYHSRHFYVLLLGRFLGGVSTSLLFSVFEAWMLEEHAARGFDAKSLNDTFAKATLGNGTAAIVAGVLSHFAAVKY
ncbi:Serine/threonine-protein kinase plk1, partial [Perkinsus olseni]